MRKWEENRLQEKNKFPISYIPLSILRCFKSSFANRESSLTRRQSKRVHVHVRFVHIPIVYRHFYTGTIHDIYKNVLYVMSIEMSFSLCWFRTDIC